MDKHDLNILHATYDYRGDHAADVYIAHLCKDGETVLQLAQRLLKSDTDWIEIRLVQKPEELE